MGGMSRRTNVFRAFGDAVYLSTYWSDEAPSRHEIADLLAALKKLGVYQLNYEGGSLNADGTIKFPTNAEPFTWEADAWCSRARHPMKFMAWLRNRDGDHTISLATPGLMRNAVYCLNFFSMFRGLLLDFDFETFDEQQAFMELLKSARETYPEMALAVRGRRAWLHRPELLKTLLGLVGDLEIPLCDVSLSGEAYRLWCADETRRAVEAVGADHLILGVPAGGGRESLEDALAGVKSGMEDFLPQRVRLAVFREGAASDDDWRVFAREWAH
jgi:hypothetical protein